MHGYLIIPMNAQILDVTHQIQVTGDIGRVHHIKVFLILMCIASVAMVA